ncbi:hypothetical protein JVU11DRAFT_10232 [Chiua virens]|nr:hypothetical protein JVU11DRAFT_10232 [Chiua virens]
MLWKVKLPQRKKRMILSIFASSVVLAFGALCHTVGQILHIHVVMTVGMHAMVALSIIVCNLLVIVTYTYRFLLRNAGKLAMSIESTEESSEGDDFTTRARPAATDSSLTTVDLDMTFTSPGASIGMGNIQTRV